MSLELIGSQEKQRAPPNCSQSKISEVNGAGHDAQENVAVKVKCVLSVKQEENARRVLVPQQSCPKMQDI